MSPVLVVETREADPAEDLLPYADLADPLVWLRGGDGIVGIGRVHELRARSGDEIPRTVALSLAWSALSEAASVDDPVRLPGTGLVGFGALVFDEDSARDSVIVVPRLIIGRHGGRGWITRIRTARFPTDEDALPSAEDYGRRWSATLVPGAQSPQGYRDAVRAALAGIAGSEYEKVVLARDLVGSAPADADARLLVRELRDRYRDTWAFAVDGLIGASPETLVTADSGTVTARVLAGTAARGSNAGLDAEIAATLGSSAKDLGEHAYAVQSVLASLRAHTRELAADERPFVLRLPNLFHLSTDVRGELTDGATALDLVGALHPTAAVAGTPTPSAIAAIRRLEPFDRGRYAGPVGWVDAEGDGEWAIALRCAQLDPLGDGQERAITAYAGAGIVAGSDPVAELRETDVKFRPVVDALS